MDRIFHHVLRNVAQIQLVLGLRRLEAQLWQGKEFQAAAAAAQAELQFTCASLQLTFMFGYSGISV